MPVHKSGSAGERVRGEALRTNRQQFCMYFKEACREWSYECTSDGVNNLNQVQHNCAWPFPGGLSSGYAVPTAARYSAIIWPLLYLRSSVITEQLCTVLVHRHTSSVLFRVSTLSEQNSTIVGRDSSVGIATRYGLDGPEIEFRWGRDFPHTSRPALGPIQPPILWVPGLSPR